MKQSHTLATFVEALVNMDLEDTDSIMVLIEKYKPALHQWLTNYRRLTNDLRDMSNKMEEMSEDMWNISMDMGE